MGDLRDKAQAALVKLDNENVVVNNHNLERFRQELMGQLGVLIDEPPKKFVFEYDNILFGMVLLEDGDCYQVDMNTDSIEPGDTVGITIFIRYKVPSSAYLWVVIEDLESLAEIVLDNLDVLPRNYNSTVEYDITAYRRRTQKLK